MKSFSTASSLKSPAIAWPTVSRSGGNRCVSAFSHLSTLVINLDNGPENHSRRTPFMQRMIDFVQHYHLHVQLAYYPPYHSKYNPIERCWGILENHWNGAILDSIETVIAYAQNYDLEGTPSDGRTGDSHLSQWREAHERGDEQSRTSASAPARLGEMVCGYLPATRRLGYIIIFESLRPPT